MNICGMNIPKRKITSRKVLWREHAWPAEETEKRPAGGSRTSFISLWTFTIFAMAYF